MPKKPPKRQLQDIIELIQDAYAPNTIRAYKADMEEFIGYCETRRISPLPAAAGTVSDFLLECATKGLRSATIRRKVASISAIHRLAEFTDPTKHTHAKLAIRKINRKLGTRFRQAYPVSKALLQSLLKACDRDLMGLRNRALLLTAYDSMRRRAELVSLRIEDIEYTTPGHARILLRKSKTDQEGTGQWVHVGKEATAAIQRWLKNRAT